MIRRSRNEDALARMRAANPCSAAELREAVTDAELSLAIQRAIAAGESPSQPIPAGDRAGFFARHRRASLGLGFACAAVVAALILLAGGSPRGGAHPSFAAAAIRVAKANPRLLVVAPGWSIVHARSFEVDRGGLTYRDGVHPAYGPDGRQLDLNWYPAHLYRERLREIERIRTRAGHPTPVASTLLGRRATTFHYAGQRPEYATVLSPQGSVFVEIVGTLGGRRQYEAALHALRPVGVAAWLAAMPPEVVGPAARPAAIAQMLHGVPLPPGFDAFGLRSEGEIPDRFMLAKSVTGAVACGWIQRWLSATRDGDGAAAREAIDAMGTARRWPVLLGMVRERGYRGNALPPHGQGWPSEILTAAREIAHGHLRHRPAVRTIYVHGRPVGYVTPAAAAPASVMGCLAGP